MFCLFSGRTEDQKDEQPATNTMTDTAGETTDSEPPIIKKGKKWTCI